MHIEWQGPWVGEVLGVEDLAIFESLLKRIAVRLCPGHFVEKEKNLSFCMVKHYLKQQELELYGWCPMSHSDKGTEERFQK